MTSTMLGLFHGPTMGDFNGPLLGSGPSVTTSDGGEWTPSRLRLGWSSGAASTKWDRRSVAVHWLAGEVGQQ